MSCLDVMYHQSYGAAHYLPAYKATYYNHHQPQQRKPSACGKMQECAEQRPQGRGAAGVGGMLPRDLGLHRGAAPARGTALEDGDPKDAGQPAEAEYLSSRCVLFTYFQGDIGDVVDEHFSRALSQSSGFNAETKPIRVSPPSAPNSAGAWKDGASLSEGQCSSVWTGSYPSQASSCLPSVSVSVHPDFSPSPVSFPHPDGTLWPGHVLSQTGLPPAASLPDTWSYSLSPQHSGGYANAHDVYHPHSHSHVHPRHHHHHHHHPHPHTILHSYPAHTPALDPRFSPLLLPGVRNQNQSSISPGSHSSSLSDGVKTEADPSSSSSNSVSGAWTPSALQGALEAYDSALDQTKAKSSLWF